VARGRVLKSTGSWYLVQRENGELVDCRIKGKFKVQGIRTTNPIAVGDWVHFENEGEENGMIHKIEKRSNYIIRKSTNLSKQAHIIASNVDRAWLIATMASPPTSTGFIDRFLVTAEAYHIPVTILFNKRDIYGEKELDRCATLWQMYEKIGYECIPVSALNAKDVEPLKNRMANAVNLFAGHSGVGKSTLINALDSRLDIRTQEVSESHSKGKHTTTFAEMHQMDNGGYIVDTPGIKGFGLIDFDKAELSHVFPEMRERIHDCKFSNCVHINEPKCAIKAAVEEGEIAVSRYENYLTMYEDDETENYR